MFEKQFLIIRRHLALIAVILVFSAGSARAESYIDLLFATPTVQEMDTTLKRLSYAPKCDAFEVGDVYMQTDKYEVHKVTFKSDGFKQTGLFGWPKARGKHPLAMINHAGFSGFSNGDDSRLVAYLERGYAIGLATYRGETGVLGLSDGKLDVIGDEMHDILNLMECAAASKHVDPNKIVMMGVSHGGGLTLAALTQTRRVKAAGIASAPSNLTNTNMRQLATKWRTQPASVEVLLQFFIRKEGLMLLKKVFAVTENDPARAPAARLEMLRRSPALFADQMTTPLIMFYGEKDPVAIYTDGESIARSLNGRGIYSKVTVFKNRGHSYNADENEQAHAEILDFFDAQLKKK